MDRQMNYLSLQQFTLLVILFTWLPGLAAAQPPTTTTNPSKSQAPTSQDAELQVKAPGAQETQTGDTEEPALTTKEKYDIAKNIALIIGVVGTLIFALIGVLQYLNDAEMKRIDGALKLYDEFDKDMDCVRAMSMVDYHERGQGFKFTYEFHATKESVEVDFNSQVFRDALEKNYRDLNDSERAVRFLMDHWLGWLERIFYCVEKGYFHVEELVFYRYWLELLLKEKFKFVRGYAVHNTCGTFTPYLKKYETTISPQIDAWRDNLESPKPRSWRFLRKPTRVR